MRRAKQFLLIFLLFAGSTSVFGDGGVLTYCPQLPDKEYYHWPIDCYSLSSTQKASMRLDQETDEDGYVLESEGIRPSRIFATESDPVRLFYDANDNGEAESGEIYEADQNLYDSAYFSNVSFNVRVGDVTQCVVVDFACHTYRGKRRELIVSGIRSCYEGTITLEGAEYPARLIFRSPFPSEAKVNEIIVLDTNDDGSFEHFHDLWFTGQGYAYLNGRPWTVESVLSEETAEVTLIPHSGRTGQLRIEGEGLERLYLETSARPTDGFPSSYEINLPPRDDGTYILPRGNYQIKNVWLRPGKEEDQLYQIYLSGIDRPRKTFADIHSSTPEILSLGGPLKDGIKVHALSLIGTVRLDYEACKNEAGYEYRLDGGEFESYGAPSWQILNSDDVVVDSGTFEYG
ncbi:MAG: hypothetical protein ABIH23_13755 [bacterium]